MNTIAHIVNPVSPPNGSDLHIAQPVTFESMRQAKKFARNGEDVEHLATSFPEDVMIVPDDFRSLEPLERSVLDFGKFSSNRKLPLLADILHRAYSESDADYIVYSNIDIAVQPYFYNVISDLIMQGHESFIVNRRTISSIHHDPSHLGIMCAQVGESHPGYDCFVFPRKTCQELLLGGVCIGAAGVGLALMLNLYALDESFAVLEDYHLTFHIGNDRVWKNADNEDLRAYNYRELNRVISKLESNYGEFNEQLPGYSYSYIREHCR